MPFITRFISSQLRTLPPVPDTSLEGKVYITTGGNSEKIGIGLEVAKHLIQRGASKVILAVRNIQSGEKAKHDILHHVKAGCKSEVEVWKVDMNSFESVKTFAEKCEGLDRLDGVALNAGILAPDKLEKTPDGHEATIQVNVLSPTYLALLLAPILEKSASVTGQKGKIVFTGSAVAEVATTKGLDIERPLKALDNENVYVVGDRYNQSKLVLHSMVRKIIARFPDIVVTDVNPGFVHTQLYRGGGPAAAMAKRIGRKSEEGARNVTFALITLDHSTDWYHDCKPSKLYAPWLVSGDGRTFGNNLWNDSLQEYRRFSNRL
ncbi:uncharacterized protein IL334_000211 [Kwoniella shivajii]|uniref:Uncharacterized protein n=1 Tax=Kwoniella shivajii TaxID=564305 RepID=A0ABZ1CRJ7_9TREE|nr:hypothetical protein IL334_000211 [Kwoniella shivajii]